MTSVSVVIPACNAGAFLPEAVASVLAQAPLPDQVLVVDDGSSDGSVEALRGQPVTVIRTQGPGPRGPSAARNLGIREARGEFVAFLDADDVWLPGHCQALVSLLLRHPRAAIAFSRVEKFDRHSLSVPTAQATLPMRPFDAFRRLLVSNFVPQSTVVARRSVLLEAGGYDETLRLAEDFDLWLRIAERHYFVGLPEITCRYRLHPRQASLETKALLHAGWSARLRAARQHSGRPAQDLSAELRASYLADLRSAWAAGSRSALDALLQIGRQVPHVGATRRWWRFRTGGLYRLWILARSLKRRVQARRAGRG